MPDSKFTCAHCKQHIQCNTSYVDTQINCPSCGHTITVPSAPTIVPFAERTIQIKISTLRKATLIGLGVFLAAGLVTAAFYFTGDSTRTVWKQWSVLEGNSNQWSFASGKIHTHGVDGESMLASEENYSDVVCSATVSTPNREASLAIRMQDAGNGYLIVFAPPRTPCPWNRNGFIAIIKKVSGNEITLASYSRRDLLTIGQTANIKVIARGPSIEVRLNGLKILDVNDSTFASGRLGLRIFGDSNYPCDASFSKIAFH
jgi:DNA-directed RNA polymerase subunit RPC12/RpoP